MAMVGDWMSKTPTIELFNTGRGMAIEPII